MKVQHTFAHRHNDETYEVAHTLGIQLIDLQINHGSQRSITTLLTISKPEARKLMDGLRMILNLRVKSRRHRSNKQVKQ